MSACKNSSNTTAPVQRWDSETKLIENGIYLGHIASLKFTGPWAMNKVTVCYCMLFPLAQTWVFEHLIVYSLDVSAFT